MAIDIEEFLPEIEQVARNVTSDFPDVDWQDVRQELCLFLLEAGKNLVALDGNFSIRKILSKRATSFCKKERAEQLSISVQYSFRPSDVRKSLEVGKIVVPEDAISMKPEMDAVDIGVDVLHGIGRLSPDHRMALYRRYTLGEIPDNASYERKKLNAAVKELTRIMNSYRGNGRRTAISNAKAQAMISKNCEG